MISLFLNINDALPRSNPSKPLDTRPLIGVVPTGNPLLRRPALALARGGSPTTERSTQSDVKGVSDLRRIHYLSDLFYI
jgi:hypothetical protein